MQMRGNLLTSATTKMITTTISSTTTTTTTTTTKCRCVCATDRYAELPVRHNEDELNGELAKLVPWEVDTATLDSPHTKAFLLLQCHFARIPLPIADYANDLASVLDQSLRVLNAMVDIAADAGLLHACLQLMHLTQMVVQGRSLQTSTLRQLPHCNSKAVVDYFAQKCSPPIVCVTW